MAKQKILIRLKAYEHRVLDQSAKRVVGTEERTGATATGPVPLPTKLERCTACRSILSVRIRMYILKFEHTSG